MDKITHKSFNILIEDMDRIEEKLDGHLKEHAEIDPYPEVWAKEYEKQPKMFFPTCPFCQNKSFVFQNPSEVYRQAVKDGYKYKCRNCEKRFTIRIHYKADAELKDFPTVWAEKEDNGRMYQAECPADNCSWFWRFGEDSAGHLGANKAGARQQCGNCKQNFLVRIREDLPVVWAEERGDGWCAKCPRCNAYQFTFNSREYVAGAKSLGYKHECMSCEKSYIIRIRPEPAKVEEFKEGDRRWSVQHWPGHEPQTAQPFLSEIIIGKKYGRLTINSVGRGYCYLSTYLDGGAKGNHLTLHATYAEALGVAAGLWEQEGTELWLAAKRPLMSKCGAYKSKIYKNQGQEYRLSYESEVGNQTSSIIDGWFLKDHLYLGPDLDLAEKFCRDKNTELEPEVDDSVLDEEITRFDIAEATLKNACKEAINWYWRSIYNVGVTPKWKHLFEQIVTEDNWAQWVVDHLADDIDPKIIAALQMKLGGGK